MADSPLKITLPANLPRNEKDLICMLLAGRLKDLFKGKLICAQLAIDDLIKQTTGFSALGSLQTNLMKMKNSLNDLKSASGYDQILSKVNSSLGQVSNVFSLGGLCPSPIQAPKIPDLLGQLNQNLFGQANNILNALAQASNPTLCLGNGPNGFGIDWSKVTGDLKNLRNAIDQFKKDPAQAKKTIAQFQANLKTQNNRLKSEFKRLGDNLADPLGINAKQNIARNIQRADGITGSLAVKDRNGVEYKNTLRLMNPGDIDYVIGRKDPIYTTPIKYIITPILDYCGVVTGYETKTISGDPQFVGWVTDPIHYETLNVPHPTVNPVASFAQYDYSIIEEAGAINVYNDLRVKTDAIKLTRGQHYRIRILLTTQSIKFYNGSSPWTSGLVFAKTPDYGTGLDIIQPVADTTFKAGDLDWSVGIENPTTPSSLTWSSGSRVGNIVIDGISQIPLADKSYDLAMAFRKSWLSSITKTNPVNYEVPVHGRTYSITTEITGIVSATATSNLAYSSLPNPGTYQVVNDNETLDYDTGMPDPGNKIITINQSIAGQKLVIKRYVNVDSGLEFKQLSCYLIDNAGNVTPVVSLNTDKSLLVSNDTKLPYNSTYSYSLVLPNDNKVTDNHGTHVALKDSNTFIWSLSDNKENNISTISANDFVYTSEVHFDNSDSGRTFVTTNPYESRIFMYFKGTNGFSFKSTITYGSTNSNGGLSAITTIPLIVLNQKIQMPPKIPVTAQGGNPIYFYSIDPDLPDGLDFDGSTGEITGLPSLYTKSLDQSKPDEYTVTIKDEDTGKGPGVKSKFKMFIAKKDADILNSK